MLGKMKALASQRQFDHAAARSGAFDLKLRTLMAILLLLFVLVTSAIFGHGLVQERSLLASGTRVDGVVTDVAIREGRSRSGEIRYDVTVNYTFTTPDGRTHSGNSVRRFSSKPHLTAGQRIGVLYDAGHPGTNALVLGMQAEINDKLVALVLFAPIAIVLLVLVWRIRRWQSKRGPSPEPPAMQVPGSSGWLLRTLVGKHTCEGG